MGNKFITLIETIEKRPSLYIGKNSIFSLSAFLSGVAFDSAYSNDYSIIDNFQQWVEKKYRITTSQSWASILNFYSSDEKDALKLFFLLFKEFILDTNEKS